MDLAHLPPDLQEVARFHGHLCPGLLIGYRAAKAAARALDLGRSQDEELVAVVENDSCSVDAFQALLGTTFGKGNLKWQDHGKQVFTVTDRRQNRAVRVAFTGDALRPRRPDGSVDRQAFMEILLAAPDEQILKIQEKPPAPPEVARIEPSLTCARCGEAVQASKAVQKDGQPLCRPCAREARP
ncbi:MAG: formylmethanofuran dehydrogenase [Desulfarculus sp.]|nr:formylmethanofuran dehydrogenase [Desulfarculus sp.]